MFFFLREENNKKERKRGVKHQIFLQGKHLTRRFSVVLLRGGQFVDFEFVVGGFSQPFVELKFCAKIVLKIGQVFL